MGTFRAYESGQPKTGRSRAPRTAQRQNGLPVWADAAVERTTGRVVEKAHGE